MREAPALGGGAALPGGQAAQDHDAAFGIMAAAAGKSGLWLDSLLQRRDWRKVLAGKRRPEDLMAEMAKRVSKSG